MFKEMTDEELLNFCEDNFCDYTICYVLNCEENCVAEDCPLEQLFCRFRRYIKQRKINEVQKDYFTPEDVRRMTAKDVRDNYSAIIESMKKWN